MKNTFATAIAIALLSASTLSCAFECETLGVDDAICQKARKGDAEAIFEAGKATLNGDFGVKLDVVSGTELLEVAAKNGNTAATAMLPDAYNKVGNAFFFGERMQADTNKAVEWYKKAALAGNAEAAYNLGCMYAWGEGVPESLAEAKKWLEMAVAKGNTAAASVLKTL